MAYDISAVRSRELGNALRRAMEKADLSGKQLAIVLGWTESRVSRALTGNAPLNPVSLSAFLAVCGVIGDERDYLLHLSDPGATLGWQTDHRILANNQQQAASITAFHGLLVPSLLQTTGYAKAVISRTLHVPVGEVRRHVAARMASQKIFCRDKPPNCTFFIHELCLQLPVGGAKVRRAQLDHLLRSSTRPYITIRVVPTSAGAQPGLIGACCLMEFADFQPMAYVDNEVAGFVVEEPEQVAMYARGFKALTAAALDEDQSRDKLRAAAASRYQGGGPPSSNGDSSAEAELVSYDPANNPC